MGNSHSRRDGVNYCFNCGGGIDVMPGECLCHYDQSKGPVNNHVIDFHKENDTIFLDECKEVKKK